jgi:AhpC/TSA family
MNLQFIATVALVMASLSCSAIQKPTQTTPDIVPSRDTPLQVGERAPDFTLPDQLDRKVTLSSAFGKSPTVLVFYRGSW